MSLDVPGQPRAVALLKGALQKGAVHHAYLFAGPSGVGKERAALGFAQALVCPERPDEGCGACASCTRVVRFTHPDVAWLLPEESQVARGLAGRSDFDHVPSRELRVDQVRGLEERLSFRPLEARRKVALLLEADAMNAQAQNALLKTLEEPPVDTVLVLVASAPDRLLTTLRSRCARVQFGPLSPELIARAVQEEKKVDGPTALLVAAMADGSLSRALEMDLAGLKAREELFRRFESLGGDDDRELLRFAEDVGSTREGAEGALRLLLLWTRDLLRVRAGAGAPANADLVEPLEAAAARTSDEALHRRYRLLSSTLEAITVRNGAPRLQLERMLLGLLPGGAA